MANQIDMNRQSDLMAAFEENIIWATLLYVHKNTRYGLMGKPEAEVDRM